MMININTPEFNKLSTWFDARLAQTNLITKPDFDVNCRVLT